MLHTKSTISPMYITYNKTTYRLLGSFINGILLFGSGIGAVGITIKIIASIIYGEFRLYYLIPFSLFWLEAIFSARTFDNGITNGPNSALWNLPLLYVDLCFVIASSNTIFLLLDVVRCGDFMRYSGFIFAILRYIGLAWTSPNFFLKRIYCPIREDTAVESAIGFY